MSNVTSRGSTRGDTLVVFSLKYSLYGHSAIIRENCKALAPLLVENPTAGEIRGKQKTSGPLKHRIDLILRDGKLTFVPKPVRLGLTDPVQSDNDGVVRESLLMALVEIFGIWYNDPPRYGNSIDAILKKGLSICQAGKLLGALAAATQNFERAWLSCRGPIWSCIAQAPVEWLLLGYTIQSVPIFKEALIHTIGKWKILDTNQRRRAGQIKDLRDLISVKLILDQQRKERIETAILAHYPQSLKDIARDIGATAPPGRNEYSNHMFEWIALDIFRQWVGQMLNNNIGHRARDGGYALYDVMSKGGDHYLKRGELNGFFERFPMSEKAKTITINAINLIKGGVKTIVAPLAVKGAQWNDVHYLTSCEFDNEDLVWLHPIDEDSKVRVQEWIKTYPEFEFWTPAAGDGSHLEPTTVSLLGRTGVDPENNSGQGS